jgi:hypothetical protein
MLASFTTQVQFEENLINSQGSRVPEAVEI